MGGVFSAISSFGVRSLPSYFCGSIFLKPVCVPSVHSVLAVQELSSDWQTEGPSPGLRSEPACRVTHMEPVSPSKARLGRPGWSLTWHRFKPLLGKRFLSGKGFLSSRLSGCCAFIPCQIAAVTTGSAICKAHIHVLFNVLDKCRWVFSSVRAPRLGLLVWAMQHM